MCPKIYQYVFQFLPIWWFVKFSSKNCSWVVLWYQSIPPGGASVQNSAQSIVNHTNFMKSGWRRRKSGIVRQAGHSRSKMQLKTMLKKRLKNMLTLRNSIITLIFPCISYNYISMYLLYLTIYLCMYQLTCTKQKKSMCQKEHICKFYHSKIEE